MSYLTLISQESSRAARERVERLGIWGPVKLITLRFFQKILTIFTRPYDQVHKYLHISYLPFNLVKPYCLSMPKPVSARTPAKAGGRGSPVKLINMKLITGSPHPTHVGSRRRKFSCICSFSA